MRLTAPPHSWEPATELDSTVTDQMAMYVSWRKERNNLESYSGLLAATLSLQLFPNFRVVSRRLRVSRKEVGVRAGFLLERLFASAFE